MKIYIVEGSSGEYDDYETWVYKVFRNKKKADKLAVELNKFVGEIAQEYNELRRLKLTVSDSERWARWTAQLDNSPDAKLRRAGWYKAEYYVYEKELE